MPPRAPSSNGVGAMCNQVVSVHVRLSYHLACWSKSYDVQKRVVVQHEDGWLNPCCRGDPMVLVTRTNFHVFYKTRA